MTFLAQTRGDLPPGLSTEGAPAAPPDIRDIAPPVPVSDARDPIAVFTLLGLGLALAAVALWRTAAAHRRPSPPPLPADPQSVAVSELVALEREVQASGSTAAETAKAAGEILARYLHRTTGAPALYRTAVELTHPLAGSGEPPVPALSALSDVLAKLEEVRFSPSSDATPAGVIDDVRWAITSSSPAA